MAPATTGPKLAAMTPPLGTATAPALGLAAAAKACGVSESTLRRRRPELLAAGARQTAKGWSIPIPALIELGLMDRTTAPDTVTSPDGPQQPRQEASTAPSPLSPTEPLLEALRAKLAAAEQRAAVAEAIAEERERIIAVQAQALRMLEALPAQETEALKGGPASTPSTPQERAVAPSGGRFRRWLNFSSQN